MEKQNAVPISSPPAESIPETVTTAEIAEQNKQYWYQQARLDKPEE
jgi:uncharacterized protein YccT (UPF0319 family)